MYKAQMNKDYKLVKSLQRLLLGSRAAHFFAVRQVTQLNKGKKTAGVDGKTALSPKQRLDLIEELNKGWKGWNHQRLRRKWIPKPDGSRRGLGIPTIKDRVVQMLLKMLLEPIYESDFLNCSNGFRPQRRTQNCIA
ncbi:MAG: reverse transcriptase N-terminal domain-containing protein, partial [Xenococcaceae cyanobacterium]